MKEKIGAVICWLVNQHRPRYVFRIQDTVTGARAYGNVLICERCQKEL